MKNILITLTSPSCGGKTHLLHYIKLLGYQALVSSTTREPRTGERNGIDYHFLSTQEFNTLKDAGKFIETNTFSGNQYGVQIEEFNLKTSLGPTFLIAEPNGVKTYEEYCKLNNSAILKYFINTTPEVRMHRFANRAQVDFENTLLEIKDFHQIPKLVKSTIERTIKSQTEETKWFEQVIWNRVLSGTDEPSYNLMVILKDIDKVKRGKYLF